MGCMSGSTDKGELDKKNSRAKNESHITVATNEDQEKMILHRERILNKKKKESPKKETMDEDELRKLLNEIFDKYDKDEDGLLSIEQFMNMLKIISQRKKSKFGFRLDQEQVRRVLAKNDEDGNVSVNRQEFYDLYKEL